MRSEPTSSSGVSERRARPGVRYYALEFGVVTVLGALPGTRRLDQWWVRQSWRRILIYRLVSAAVGVDLIEWGERYSRRAGMSREDAD